MPLIYVLSNQWYMYDNVYKVGKHGTDDIGNLLRQYASRYIPLKQLLYSRHVDDCDTVEAMIHSTLDCTDGIDRVDGEWYRGNVEDIISVVDSVSETCLRDPYSLRIDYEDGRSIVYPLSHVSDRKLHELGQELGIRNVYSMSAPAWRDLQIRLLFYRDNIMRIYESGGHLSASAAYRWEKLTGYGHGDDILHKVYRMVNPHCR